MKNTPQITDFDRALLRTITTWKRGEEPTLTAEQVNRFEALEELGLVSPRGAGLYNWPWVLTDDGRRAAGMIS